MAIWKWVQRIRGFRKIFKVNCRVSVFLVDETAVNVAGKLAWVWVAYEPYSKKILGFLGLEIHTKLSFS